MRYSLTILENTYQEMCTDLFGHGDDEWAGYLFANKSATEDETRLLAQEWRAVLVDHVDRSSPTEILIDSASYRSAMKHADETKRCLVFVHSHPHGPNYHSKQDDIEEASLFRTSYIRIHSDGPHASIVLASRTMIGGRIWHADGHITPLSRFRIIGTRFQIIDCEQGESAIQAIYDRQVRAFGEEAQRLLAALHVGVVGVGGTGSSVLEQLIRLGVGTITIADGEAFDETNVTRVYGSCLTDGGAAKVAIGERNAAHIGVGTNIISHAKPIVCERVMKAFRNCDLIFCCVDRELPRTILCKFALYYMIPVFDMGVEIDSENGIIRAIEGRVTTLVPGAACLYCRGRISTEVVSAEAIVLSNPSEAARLRSLGYAPELAIRDPAVIAFTTAVAASAVNELIHRVTGHLGSERRSNEVILQFSETRLRTNARASSPGCFCGDQKLWGRGDRSQLLDMVWVTGKLCEDA